MFALLWEVIARIAAIIQIIRSWNKGWLAVAFVFVAIVVFFLVEMHMNGKSEVESDIAGLQIKIVKLEGENEELKEEIKKLKKKPLELPREPNGGITDPSIFNNNETQYPFTPKPNPAELDKLKGKIDKLKYEKGALHTQNQRLQSENKELRSQDKHKSLRSKNEELYSKNKSLQRNNEELHSKNKSLQRNNEELHSKNKSLQRNNEELHSKNKSLQRNNKELHSRNKSSQNEIAVLENQLDALTQDDNNVELPLLPNYDSLPKEPLQKIFHDKSSGVRSSALSKNNQGYIAFDKREFAKAIALFEDGIQKDSKAAVIYYNLGCTYLETEKYAEAVNYFSKAVTLDSNYKEACYNLAVTYLRWADNSQEAAEKAAYEALNIDANYPKAHQLLAAIE